MIFAVFQVFFCCQDYVLLWILLWFDVYNNNTLIDFFGLLIQNYLPNYSCLWKSFYYNYKYTAMLCNWEYLCRSVVQHCSCADWFVLQQLTSNSQRQLSLLLMKLLQKYFTSSHKHRVRTHLVEGRRRRDFYSDDEEIYSKPSVWSRNV